MNEGFTELGPNTELWRYMDLARFLALIDQKQLYFSRLHELEDHWEGAYSSSDPLFSRDDPKAVRLAVTDYMNWAPLVSCWHENDTESVAMWELYLSGREGVAIKTAASSLIRLLSMERELKLGRVGYCDVDGINKEPEVFTFEQGRRTGKRPHHIERYVFRKNPSYKHEQEVRALIYDTYSVEQAITNSDSAERLKSRLRGERPKPPAGLSVSVDISVLIQRIVVSPRFPQWAIKSVQKAVDAALSPAPPVAVEASILLNKPENGK